MTGRVYTLDVDPDNTIDDVAQMIQEKAGIPPEGYRLIFAGKELWNNHRTLRSFNIQNDSSLHLVMRLGYKHTSSTGQNTPPESVFPDDQQALSRMKDWKALAEKGNFDADIHTVDPQAHYAVLDYLEKKVVTSTELYHHSGSYRLDDGRQPPDLRHLTSESKAPDWMNNLILDLHEGMDLGTSATITSLCETYFIILSVLENLNRMKSMQFSTTFFSMLMERSNGTVAEIVKIPEKALIEFKDALEVAIAVAREEQESRDWAYSELSRCIQPAVEDFLGLFDSPQLPKNTAIAKSVQGLLMLCRMIACILDLGMVSYAGSHGTRFDTAYFNRDMDPLRFDMEDGLSFDCSLRKLACLNGFLDTKSVWVFRAGVDLPPLQNKGQKQVSILTTIDALADIWGPVWAEATDEGSSNEKPARIKKYHVSKGVIRRIREGPESAVPGQVKCHWYSWTEDYRRRFSTLFTRTEDLPMAVGDKLLIGSELRVNQECRYTLQEYEMNYGDAMRNSGPKPSKWKLDGVAMSVQLAAPKVIAFQIQGSVKKIPETTVKQFLWQKWTMDAEHANPGVLNNYYGVEISHCTGNARRIPLKQLLLTEPVQQLLERQIPGWSSTDWGLAFQKVLQTDSDSVIFKFWNDYYSRRSQIGQLVRCVLDVLDDTGNTDNGFRAAFLYQNRELDIHLTMHSNEWASLLKDSYLTATYAIVNNLCLECRRPDHSASICNDELRYTVLQTQVGFKKGAYRSDAERLKIEPHNQIYKKVDDNAADGPYIFVTPESSFRRLLGNGFNVAVSRELLNHSQYRLRDQTMCVTLRASAKSYGGMSYQRDRNILACDGNIAMEDLVAIQEALSQAEIEAIQKEDMQAQQAQERENAIS